MSLSRVTYPGQGEELGVKLLFDGGFKLLGLLSGRVWMLFNPVVFCKLMLSFTTCSSPLISSLKDNIQKQKKKEERYKK